MAKKKAQTTRKSPLGFEEKLWAAADKLRGHMDPSEYKHVALGLIFLKYVSDAFEKRYNELAEASKTPGNALYVKEETARYQLLEDRDEYEADNVFWVPPDARWAGLQAKAKDPKIGVYIDEAMQAIEEVNPKLRGVLPKNFARQELDKTRLGEIIDLFSSIDLGDAESQKNDVLGRAYEYFLGRFAGAEGKFGGQFYTPRSVVRVLVEMLEPYKGRVLDPCCGSGGMFVQSDKFVQAHNGNRNDISVYGQESNATTWRLAKMNLAIRGIEANLGSENADTFNRNLHPDLKADFVLANPPFNDSDWASNVKDNDPRWAYGIPPRGNGNYAWIQHFIHHLAPHGTTGFVMANGSISSQQSGEGEIRKAIIEADLVDCMVALPGQLFHNTQIPACLWFLARQKNNGQTSDGRDLRDRRGETLFIDARQLGFMADRTHREFSDEDIARIADTYHSWRMQDSYQDVPGFCKAVTTEDIRRHNYVLTPGRYVGTPEAEEDDEPFEEKMARLTTELQEQFAESARLEAEIRKNLKELGYGDE
ncbi:MAG TPA: class I SAM-dependent DNA methyltransferase [Anaerolineales bacterium]|nr:class I SAM-dependent DNA methyltransferase [Anaerolineales bacterium]HRQ93367.1 class I SAM-dependent DNA methyltransferase [Anaerolineales bacterium]